MAYALDPADDAFFATAPIVVPTTVELDADPGRVWDALGSDLMWSWAPIIDRVQWITPRPLSGTPIRRLRVAALATIEEEFYRWEAPRRATFRVTHTTRPILRGLAEDFKLDPLDDGGRTRLTWTMALKPNGDLSPAAGRRIAKAIAPGNAFGLSGLRKIV
jgi:hypothetical protein